MRQIRRWTPFPPVEQFSSFFPHAKAAIAVLLVLVGDRRWIGVLLSYRPNPCELPKWADQSSQNENKNDREAPLKMPEIL
jgi:hypothetical protein